MLQVNSNGFNQIKSEKNPDGKVAPFDLLVEAETLTRWLKDYWAGEAAYECSIVFVLVAVFIPMPWMFAVGLVSAALFLMLVSAGRHFSSDYRCKMKTKPFEGKSLSYWSFLWNHYLPSRAYTKNQATTSYFYKSFFWGFFAAGVLASLFFPTAASLALALLLISCVLLLVSFTTSDPDFAVNDRLDSLLTSGGFEMGPNQGVFATHMIGFVGPSDNKEESRPSEQAGGVYKLPVPLLVHVREGAPIASSGAESRVAPMPASESSN